MDVFMDKTKVNAILDRQLMGEKTRKDLIGEIWTVLPDDGSPDIVKVNSIICKKTGFTALELEGMKAVDLMVREETVKIHMNKYFKEAFKAGKDMVMRSHGQGFQLKKKDGSYVDVELGVVFVREDPALEGERMIPRSQRENFIFGVLRIIFKDDFGKIIED